MLVILVASEFMAGHPRETDDGRRHRLITANQLLKMQDQSDSMIYEILRRALVQDVHFYDDLFTVETVVEKRMHLPHKSVSAS